MEELEPYNLVFGKVSEVEDLGIDWEFDELLDYFGEGGNKYDVFILLQTI